MLDEVIELLEEELSREALCEVPEDLLVRVREYVERLRELAHQNLVQEKLAEREEELLRQALAALIEARVRKLLKVASSDGGALQHLLAYEYQLMGELFSAAAPRKQLQREEVKGVGGRVVIRFISEVPAIVGTDLRAYGPFKQEDVASIPLENAQVLIERGVAIPVSVASSRRRNK